MALDIKLLYFLNNLIGKSKFFDALVVFLASYLQYFLIAAFLLLLFFSAYSRREKIYIFWTTAASIIIARLGIAEIIRFFYHRPRPFLTLNIHELLSNGWFYCDKEWSFPSGHAAFFFAMAAAFYLNNKKWGIWFFLAALLISISRIIAGVHYPSDILGGMIVGIVVAYTLVFLTKRRYRLKLKPYDPSPGSKNN